MWKTYTGPFRVVAQGLSGYVFRSWDEAGNVEATKAVNVGIDTRRPETRLSPTVVRRGGTAKLEYRVTDPVPGCGRARVVLRVYEGDALRASLRPGVIPTTRGQRFLWTCRLAPGRYTMRAYATDVAGNVQRRVGSASLTVR